MARFFVVVRSSRDDDAGLALLSLAVVADDTLRLVLDDCFDVVLVLSVEQRDAVLMLARDSSDDVFDFVAIDLRDLDCRPLPSLCCDWLKLTS